MRREILDDLLNVKRENVNRIENNLYEMKVGLNKYRIEIGRISMEIAVDLYESPLYKTGLCLLHPSYSLIKKYFNEELNIYYNSDNK